MLESVALNKPYEYESIFAIYDFETCGVTTNKKFGKKSELLA
jgi:hypothetical protein